ncbi:Protein MON2 homolog, partial [Geodia barretti]
LSGASLDHLISALCQLSLDEVSSSPNREPSLFAMTSLLETGVANLERIDLIWPPITSHFIEVCSSSEATLRGFAADSLSSLIRSALPLAKNQVPYLPLFPPIWPVSFISTCPHDSLYLSSSTPPSFRPPKPGETTIHFLFSSFYVHKFQTINMTACVYTHLKFSMCKHDCFNHNSLII